MARARVLQQGKTNIETTDISDFAFHSDYPTLKIDQSDSNNIVMLANTSAIDIEITHNLGYQPNEFVFVKHNNKLFQIYGGDPCGIDIPLSFDGTPLGFNGTAFGFASFDTTKLYVEILLLGGFTATNNQTFTVYHSIQLDEE